MLNENNTLQHLDIRTNNEIGDAGIREICEGLQNNSTLTTLDAWDCGLSVEGSYTVAS